MNAVQKKLLNLFLLGLVAVLAGWLLFYTLGKKEEVEAEKKEAERVLPAGLSVARLTLKSARGNFELEQVDGAWRLVAPLVTAAEKSTVDGMVGHLLALEQLRRVGKKGPGGEITPPDDLWLFALEPPRFTVTLVDEGGDEVTLLVGKKNAFDGSIYVKLDDASDVMQVDGALEYQVDKNLYQLREKRLLTFEEDAVTQLSVNPADGVPWVVGREGLEFVVTEPRRLPADRAQVTGMLSALANVRAKEFVSEQGTEEERDRYGLAQPTVRVELRVGDANHEIWLARQREGNDLVHYAMRAGEHPIMQLSSDWVFKKVNISLDALRDKRVLRVDRDAVRTVTLTRGETQLAFEKVEGGEELRARWRMVQPEAGEADNATLAGILFRLSSMKAKMVIKEEATDEDLEGAGLAEPEVEVELGGVDGPLGVVRFGKELEGERLASNGRCISLVEASVISDLSFELGDYREAKPPE